MTRLEIIEKLREWSDVFALVEAQMDALAMVVGSTPESPLNDAVYAMWGRYTKTLSDSIGASKDSLEWYCWECQMGNRPMQAVSSTGESLMVASVEDLATMIQWP